MDKIFAVMRREFVERGRTQAFLLRTAIVPLLTLRFRDLPPPLMPGGSRARSVVWGHRVP